MLSYSFLLAYLRDFLGISQREAADVLNVSQTYLSLIEVMARNPDLDDERLAEYVTMLKNYNQNKKEEEQDILFDLVVSQDAKNYIVHDRFIKQMAENMFFLVGITEIENILIKAYSAKPLLGLEDRVFFMFPADPVSRRLVSYAFERFIGSPGKRRPRSRTNRRVEIPYVIDLRDKYVELAFPPQGFRNLPARRDFMRIMLILLTKELSIQANPDMLAEVVEFPLDWGSVPGHVKIALEPPLPLSASDEPVENVEFEGEYVFRTVP